MKLIDANRLRDAVLDLPNCYNGYSDTYDKSLIIGLIDEQIAVDAVRVVRCKDCQYAGEPIYEVENDYWCSKHGIYIYENDYCSYGEKQ